MRQQVRCCDVGSAMTCKWRDVRRLITASLLLDCFASAGGVTLVLPDNELQRGPQVTTVQPALGPLSGGTDVYIKVHHPPLSPHSAPPSAQPVF